MYSSSAQRPCLLFGEDLLDLHVPYETTKSPCVRIFPYGQTCVSALITPPYIHTGRTHRFAPTHPILPLRPSLNSMNLGRCSRMERRGRRRILPSFQRGWLRSRRVINQQGAGGFTPFSGKGAGGFRNCEPNKLTAPLNWCIIKEIQT